jgi:hypothetical protein
MPVSYHLLARFVSSILCAPQYLHKESVDPRGRVRRRSNRPLPLDFGTLKKPPAHAEGFFRFKK